MAGAAGSGRRFRNKPNAIRPLSGNSNETGILAARHEIMVNDCLTGTQRAVPAYRKPGEIFDFGRSSAYNAAFSIPIPDESKKRPHGRTFPVQEHHAPQGPAGCPEIQAVL
jgi:hypothetical protein